MEPSKAYRSKSQFSRNPKIDDVTIIRLVHAFCHGLSIRAAANAGGVSLKTARKYYIELRERLRKPQFRKWHRINITLPNLPSPEADWIVKATFFDVLGECYANKTCYRNFKAGNRKNRICRRCPVPAKFTEGSRAMEAVDLIDAVRRFYETMGIRSEAGRDQVSLFRIRLIHTLTITTAKENSTALDDGLMDPLQKTFLSFGTLLDTMLEELVLVRAGTR